jgi:branched-chain amino acid transport system substrate-binding protein
MRITRAGTAAAAAALAWAGSAAAQQGVSGDEVLVGSNADLSGIFGPFNVQAVQAAQLVFDEVNAEGGVHGRQIRLIVEDHGYQMPRALTNFNKLVNSDGVFAMILNLGTPMNLAGFPIMASRQVANISPLTASKEMIAGDTGLKYTATSSYRDQILAAVEYLAGEGAGDREVAEVCAMYIPSDFGEEIAGAAEEKAGELGLAWAAETTHRPDEGEFTGAVSRLRDAGCDIVATGLGVRQTIVAVSTARSLGWEDVTFVGSSAAFHEAIASQPGGVTEGYVAASGWADWKPRADDPEVSDWAARFEERHDAEPGMAAILGNQAARTFVEALRAAGPDLTPESFREGMESLSFRDPVADIEVTYGPDDHQGADDVVISVVRDGVFEELARR